MQYKVLDGFFLCYILMEKMGVGCVWSTTGVALRYYRCLLLCAESVRGVRWPWVNIMPHYIRELGCTSTGCGHTSFYGM